ncbi:hypothetical protein Tco_1527867 [Tanacetum coccineum]
MLEGYYHALKSLIKNHNKKNTVDPRRLDFGEEDTEVRDNHMAKGKAVVDNDLKNPFKEAVQTPLNRRIIEFTSPEIGRYNLPVIDWKESGAYVDDMGDLRRNLREPQEYQGSGRPIVTSDVERNVKPQREDGNNRNTRIRSSIDCGFDVGLVVNGDLARLGTIVKLG